MNFVHATYYKLLDAFRKARYRSASISEAAGGRQPPPLLILRHDVEWNPRRALALAEIDRACGIRSTFYFRVDTRAYDLTAMRYLQDEGFEVGYHFNTLDRCHGDFAAATALFEEELRRLREAGIDVTSVKQHGNPRVKKVGYKANGDILTRDPDLLRRNGVSDPDSCLMTCYRNLFYLSDTGIRWNPPLATDELLTGISQTRWPVIYMANHPDYWSRSTGRAMGLQVAAVGLRLSRLNTVVMTARHAVTALRGRRQHW